MRGLLSQSRAETERWAETEIGAAGETERWAETEGEAKAKDDSCRTETRFLLGAVWRSTLNAEDMIFSSFTYQLEIVGSGGSGGNETNRLRKRRRGR